jgi:high affinity Mn2+ porin
MTSTLYLGARLWKRGSIFINPEIDRNISAGISMTEEQWRRQNDNIGIAYVASGISNPHKDFILGDGNFMYGWEHLAEAYYFAELVKNRFILSAA